jgi:apolipoprotein D and lipocalin family protein
MRIPPLAPTIFAALAVAGCSTALVAPLLPSYRDRSVTIASKADFDPARYAGRWYEIARFPVPFQSGCQGAVAEYGPPADGVLSVRNLCLDAAGTVRGAATGKASLTGPGRLTVTLDGVPFRAPLWVLWTDEDYRTAVLGQPDGRAGWILARTPTIPEDRLRAAQEVLKFNGYDPERLIASGAMARIP